MAATIIIGIVIAGLFIQAFRYLKKHGSCADCMGKSSCSGNCACCSCSRGSETKREKALTAGKCR